MELADFTSQRAGQLIQQTSGYRAFVPKSLPPDPALTLDGECVQLLSQADRALGELNGLASIISEPDLFVYLYVRKEALLSSQIEGTQCSLEDVLSETPEDASSNAASPELSPDIEEVSNYVRAMSQGLARLKELPVSGRLLREMHAVLMAGVRGSNKTPGEFRTSQNLIGSPGATPATAQFVPPPPHEVASAMGALENYIHGGDSNPPLIRAALIHAQFETIHPFLDGNGRLGRLLITFVLCNWNVMQKPLLYLSYFFKANRTEYYARLMGVRAKGDWENWVKFFLRGVAETAQMASQAAIEIHKLHRRDTDRIRTDRSNASMNQVFHEFCHFPIATVPELLKRIPGSNAMTINRTIKKLIGIGILQQTGTNQRNRRFIYAEYVNILTRDTRLRIG